VARRTVLAASWELARFVGLAERMIAVAGTEVEA
jgi:hypothetical protein